MIKTDGYSKMMFYTWLYASFNREDCDAISNMMQKRHDEYVRLSIMEDLLHNLTLYNAQYKPNAKDFDYVYCLVTAMVKNIGDSMQSTNAEINAMLDDAIANGRLIGPSADFALRNQGEF